MENTKIYGNIRKEDFQTTIDNQPVDLYILNNSKGVQVAVTNLGAKIVTIVVPDKNGKPTDVVLGKSNIKDYTNDQEPYFGAVCGRTGNRIANGKFSLEGKEYQLAINNGPNNLHGGIKGFNAVVWKAEQTDAQTLKLSYLSKDGEEGFPGNLQVDVTYKLTDDNALEIDYKAVTDQTTILNLTNHSYFNLSGEGDPYVGDQLLQINADAYLPTNDVAIPLGSPEKVEGTPFDFRNLFAIGERINQEDTQLQFGNGYDHTFIINRANDELTFTAKAISPKTGIVMDVYTTEPGVQLYTGNFLDGAFEGKNGHTYPKRSAFCLETQHYPDSINHPDYPSVILKPGEEFNSKTVFAFSVDK